MYIFLNIYNIAFRLLPTENSTLPNEDIVHQQVSSSKNDVIEAKMLTNRNSREQRFLFANKNQFVIVSTTVTSYALVNTTITVTRNLLNPIPELKPGGKCAKVPGLLLSALTVYRPVTLFARLPDELLTKCGSPRSDSTFLFQR
jgi:hypothetical protein